MANELEIPVISDKFITQLGETIKGLDKLDASAKTTHKSLEKTFDDSQLIDFSTGVRTVDKSFDNISDSAKEYEKSIEDVVKTQKEWITGSRKLKDVQAETEKVEEAIKGVGKAQEDIAVKSEKTGGLLQRFIGGIGTAFKGFIILAIGQKLLEYIGSIGETVREVDKLRSSVALLTNETGDSLNEATGKIRAIATVFPDISPDETLRAASNASKQLGVDINTVLDTIGDGLARGANANGEYLSSLIEYSSVAKDAGLSLGQFNEILIKTTELGVYSDKGIDAVKESTLRLREFTKATESALVGAFGADFTKEIRLQVDSGDTFGAIQKISGAITDTDLNAQQLQTVIADVFGGPGEDVGLTFLATLKDIDGKLDEVGGTAGKYISRQKELLAITIEYEKANAELADVLGNTANTFDVVFTAIKAVGLRAFVEIVKAARDELVPTIVNLANTFKGFLNAIGVASKESTIFQTVLNGIVGVAKVIINIFGLAINVIGVTVNVIKALYENLSVVRVAIDAVVLGVQGLAYVLLNLPQVIDGLKSGISAFFSTISDNLSTFAKNVRETFSSFGNIKELITGERSLTEGFKAVGESTARAFNEGFSGKLGLKKKLEEELKSLEGVERTLRIQGFTEDADKVKAEIAALKKQLEGLQEPVTPNITPLAPDKKKALGISADDLKRQDELKKQAEALAKERAKTLADIEAKFIEQKKALAKEAAQIEVESLTESAEKIKRRHELVLQEIDDRETELKTIKAQIEVRRDVEAGRFKGNDADIELEAKRRVSAGLVQLEQSQTDELNKIRNAANTNYVQELGAFNDAVYKKNLERLQQTQDAEKERLSQGLASLQAEFELNKSALEAQTEFTNAKGELINSETEQEQQRQTAILNLQKDYLQKQIAFYQALTSAQVGFLGGQDAVNTIINNLQTQLNAVGKQLQTVNVDAKIDIFKLLGINIDDESKRKITEGLKSLTDQIGAIITDSINSQIAEQERLIDSIDRQISARENAADREKDLLEAGFANNYETEKAALDALQAQREEAVEKKLQLERRAQAISKAAAIGQILTAEAVAIAELLKASSGNPLNFLTGGAAGIIQFTAGLAQILATIGSVIAILNSAPKFKKGSSNITGGTENEDSVVSWLMPGEAVIPKERAHPNRELMEGLVEDDRDKVKAGVIALLKNFGIDITEIAANLVGGHGLTPAINLVQPGSADSAFIARLAEAKANLRQLEIQQNMLGELKQIRQNTGKTANTHTLITPTAEGYTQITLSETGIETTHRALSKPVQTSESQLLELLLNEVKKLNLKND